jgi:nicotinic acid mononucleotide adenylyltransferase
MRHAFSHTLPNAGRAWAVRHDAAVATLDNTRQLVSLAQAVDAAHPDHPPRAVWVSGDHRARSATRVALFPGSFNPLTNAHIALTAAARTALSLDLVIWSLAVSTIDKERVARASIADRLAQLRSFASFAAVDAVALINRGLYVDQVRAVRSHLAADATLTVLVGIDKVVQLFDPRYYDDRDGALAELFALANLAVAPREGAGETELHALLSRTENAPFASHISLINVAARYAGDSSTEARRLAAAEGASERIHALLPAEGVALVETRAFIPPQAHDAYEWRQRWLHTLVGLCGTLPTRVPALSALVGWTRADDARGARLRDWLANASGGAHSWPELRRLLRTRPTHAH